MNSIDNIPAIMDLSTVHNKKDGATTNTPATSASSSPALSSTTPNEDFVNEMHFEELYVGSSKEEIHIHGYDNDDNNNGANEEKRHSSWVAPASKKSLRTHNPIRAIVDPIMASSIKSGVERGDGKDQISLAVSISLSITPCSFHFFECRSSSSIVPKNKYSYHVHFFVYTSFLLFNIQHSLVIRRHMETYHPVQR